MLSIIGIYTHFTLPTYLSLSLKKQLQLLFFPPHQVYFKLTSLFTPLLKNTQANQPSASSIVFLQKHLSQHFFFSHRPDMLSNQSSLDQSMKDDLIQHASTVENFQDDTHDSESSGYEEESEPAFSPDDLSTPSSSPSKAKLPLGATVSPMSPFYNQQAKKHTRQFLLLISHLSQIFLMSSIPVRLTGFS